MKHTHPHTYIPGGDCLVQLLNHGVCVTKNKANRWFLDYLSDRQRVQLLADPVLSYEALRAHDCFLWYGSTFQHYVTATAIITSSSLDCHHHHHHHHYHHHC